MKSTIIAKSTKWEEFDSESISGYLENGRTIFGIELDNYFNRPATSLGPKDGEKLQIMLESLVQAREAESLE